MRTTTEKMVRPVTMVQRRASQPSFFRKAGEGMFGNAAKEPSFFSAAPSIQSKLTVSKPGDPLEAEADANAEKVMRMPEPASKLMQDAPQDELQRKEEEAITAKEETHSPEAVQRKEKEDVHPSAGEMKRPDDENILRPKEEEIQQKQEENADPSLMAKSNSNRGPPAIHPSFDSALQHSRGTGSPLDGHTLRSMEGRFGADFGDVRVHTGAQAHALSGAISAQAFTHGSDIYFNTGKYNPHTRDGGLLLAHELTHTLQQRGTSSLHRSCTPALSNAIQCKSNNSEEVATRPELHRAVHYARAEIGKVNAKAKDATGKRVGHERLYEYFTTAMGPEQVLAEGMPYKQGSVAEKYIRYYDEVLGNVPDTSKDGATKKEMRDAMPSWCGIFVFWALNKGGVPMNKWKLGQSAVDLKSAYPPRHVPRKGDIAYKGPPYMHYAIVDRSVPEDATPADYAALQVTTINGNTAGTDNLGGQVAESTDPVSAWTAKGGFFNPLYGKEAQLAENPEPFVIPANAVEVETAAAEDRTDEKEKEETQPATEEEKHENVHADEALPPPEPISVSEKLIESDLPPLPVLSHELQGEANETVEQAVLSGTSDNMIHSVTTLRPSQIAVTYPMLGGAVTAQLTTDNTSVLSTVPAIGARSGGIKDELAIQPPLMPEGSAALTDGITGADPPPLVASPHQYAQPPPESKGLKNKMQEIQDEGGFWGWFRSAFSGVMNGISTTDSGCSTSAGERPVMDTSGSADSARTDVQHEEASGEIMGQGTEAITGFKDHPGQESVQPVEVNQDFSVPTETPAPEALKTENNEELTDYAALQLPPEMKKAADNKVSEGLQPKLEKTRTEVGAAVNDRDKEKDEAISNTQLEANALNTQADADQKKTVKDNRALIAAEQTKGMQEAQKKITDFKDESGKEKTTLKADMKTRIEADEKEAAETLKKAEEDAEKEKLLKEEEARKKKAEMEKKKDDESWWSSIKNAVKRAVKALTDAIDGIFTALRNAVKSIIDKAKNFAIALIEKGRKWLVEKIDGFRNWLKEKVNKYLKDFPALQKAINGAIDSVADGAIKTVNAVADTLKKGIEKLAAALGKFLDKILAKFQGLLKAAVGILGAVLTGDFAEALKIAFFAVCELAGIDPNPILNFVDKAKQQLKRILKDVGQFTRNVGKGIQTGFSQFYKKIKQHLITGVISWLTGALGEIKITIPETWDAKGIFQLVMQVLGLTYTNIRSKVVKAIGPKGETVISTIETTVGFVKDLVTKGPAAFWEHVKESLVNLKDMVMEEIRNWLITTVIKEGIIWLLSLTNPASAIVRALKMILDVVLFLVEKYQQIKDFVLTVYEMVTEIAMGNTSKVANAVENVLARIIPVFIGLLASVLGLGGIAKSVTKVIKKVTDPINKAIDKIVKKIVDVASKLLGKGKEAAKNVKDKIVEWWKARKKFRLKNGETHTLYFEGNQDNARLMMRSVAIKYVDYIKAIRIEGTNKTKMAQQQAAKKKALVIAAEIDLLISQHKRTSSKGETKDVTPEFHSKLNELAEQTIIFSDRDDGQLPVSTNPEYGSLRNGFATSMHIRKLTRLGPKGTKVSAESPIMNDLLLRKVNTGKYYVAGHLLNNNMHGPGYTWQNLTPLTQAANQEHLRLVEKDLKSAIQEKLPGKGEQGRVFDYRITVEYAHPLNTDLLAEIDKSAKSTANEKKRKIITAEQFIAKGLSATVKEVDYTGNPVQGAKALNLDTSIANSINQTSLDAYKL